MAVSAFNVTLTGSPGALCPILREEEAPRGEVNFSRPHSKSAVCLALNRVFRLLESPLALRPQDLWLGWHGRDSCGGGGVGPDGGQSDTKSISLLGLL